MNLIFEKSRPGCRGALLPPCDVPAAAFSPETKRAAAPRLPELAEVDLVRHYTALEKRCYGVDEGFYPLGSCTMKYNPKLNEAMAALPGFTDIHPLQPAETVQGCLGVLALANKYLCSITGMDAMTFQPAAGAHGEYTGLLLIHAYHRARGDEARTKIIVPDSAHGTNPASAAMAGFTVVNIPSGADGCVDLAALRAAVGPDTAGLMLTNPNTLGIFDKHITEITQIVHEAGGLCYYDGANLNAIMGVARPGDMGFDVIHLNLHKTFSTPHGGGGPGSGTVGCKALLTPFLPGPVVSEAQAGLAPVLPAQSIGRMMTFGGNFLVVVKALTYILSLGAEGIPEAACGAVLNANYLKKLLSERFEVVSDEFCMHEFVITMRELYKEKHVSALDIAKGLIDQGIHPPTIYFPLIVPEALMLEPTETESMETLDAAAAAFFRVLDIALTDGESLHHAPHSAVISRPDETTAARKPHLCYSFEEA